jgi:hypothetical protein
VLTTKVGFTNPTTFKLGWQFTMLAPVLQPGGTTGNRGISNSASSSNIISSTNRHIGGLGGWVFLGELDKYVPVASNRVLAITSHGYRDFKSGTDPDLVVEVCGARGERVSLTMITPGGKVLVVTVEIATGGLGTLSCWSAHNSCRQELS